MSELLLMRNAHAPYKPGDDKNGAELGPISPQGVEEAREAAGYLTSILGGRSLKFYASPLTHRAHVTALQTAAYVEQHGAPMPMVYDLFKVPDDIQPVGSLRPNKVAQKECEATLTLGSHLASVEELVNDKALSVVVMSGRAIWLYFGQSLGIWPRFGEATIPTGCIIHTTHDKFTGFSPHGHKAEPLAQYFEQQRLKPRI